MAHSEDGHIVAGKDRPTAWTKKRDVVTSFTSERNGRALKLERHSLTCALSFVDLEASYMVSVGVSRGRR